MRPEALKALSKSDRPCYNRPAAMLDWVLLIAGTVLGVVSLVADLVGLGGFPGFGWKQALGVAVGLVLVGVSAVRIYRRERGGQPEPGP